MNSSGFEREEHWGNEDDVVRGTNEDATVSRMSAASLGYIEDPFVHFFVKRPIQRPPIINRGDHTRFWLSLFLTVVNSRVSKILGSYLRVTALNDIARQFLQSSDISDKKQIVSLGAGFDTRYFLLKAGIIPVDAKTQFKYFEVDFPEMTAKKAFIIKRQKKLASMLDNPVVGKYQCGGQELSSSDFALIGGDLRDWSKIVERLIHHGFQADLPTLFISECVLIYLAPEESQSILDWITANVQNTMFLLYEQILPDDTFGKVMLRNLKSRNIELKGIHAYPTLEAQIQRFKQLNWSSALAVDINTLHDRPSAQNEIKRISQLQLLDELEEWRLLAAHYCVAWAWKCNIDNSGLSNIRLS